MRALFIGCVAGLALAGSIEALAVPGVVSSQAPEGVVLLPLPFQEGGGGCPCASGTPEGEANCGLPTDSFNGGCNSVPEATSPIALNSPVCGTAAFQLSIFTRDTDWYEYTVENAGDFTWRVEAAFPAAMFILDNACPPNFFGQDNMTGCGDVGEITANLQPGTYRFFIAPEFLQQDLACGSEYTAELIGEDLSVLAIPTMSKFGLAAIALALVGFALLRLRRRSA